jgi:hypothetical protein
VVPFHLQVSNIVFVFIAIWMVQIVLFDLGVSGSPCFNEYWIIHRLWLFDLGIYELCLVWYRYVIILQHFFLFTAHCSSLWGSFWFGLWSIMFPGAVSEFFGWWSYNFVCCAAVSACFLFPSVFGFAQGTYISSRWIEMTIVFLWWTWSMCEL